MTQQLELNVEQAEEFVGRLFNASLGAIDVFTVYVGDRLGLYQALAENGALTFPELAASAGIDERYAREWLEQQAATGFVQVDDVAAAPGVRRFSLPAEHAAALIDPDSPLSIAPLARAVASVGVVLPQLLEAYRTGGGVPWSAFGADGIEAQGDFNRPWIRSALAAEYLPSVPDVHEQLTSGARVADIACGVGWAGITSPTRIRTPPSSDSTQTTPRSRSLAGWEPRTACPSARPSRCTTARSRCRAHRSTSC